jgi:hypothetical protein
MKIIFKIILILLICSTTSKAGFFTKEPPAEWNNTPIIYEWSNDSGYAVVYLDKQNKKNYFLFGQFISVINTDISWKKGKDSKWILKLKKYDDEIDKTIIIIMVFKKTRTPLGNTGILLKRLNVDGQDLPAFGIQMFLLKAANDYLAVK